MNILGSTFHRPSSSSSGAAPPQQQRQRQRQQNPRLSHPLASSSSATAAPRRDTDYDAMLSSPSNAVVAPVAFPGTNGSARHYVPPAATSSETPPPPPPTAAAILLRRRPRPPPPPRQRRRAGRLSARGPARRTSGTPSRVNPGGRSGAEAARILRGHGEERAPTAGDGRLRKRRPRRRWERHH